MIELASETVTRAAAEYNLGSIDQIPVGEGRDFNVAGREIAVFRPRLDGDVYATQATCPHKQGPLADGIVGGTTIVCPFHAWKFDIRTGLPLATNPGEGCLKTYPIRVTESGCLIVSIGEGCG